MVQSILADCLKGFRSEHDGVLSRNAFGPGGHCTECRGGLSLTQTAASKSVAHAEWSVQSLIRRILLRRPRHSLGQPQSNLMYDIHLPTMIGSDDLRKREEGPGRPRLLPIEEIEQHN